MRPVRRSAVMMIVASLVPQHLAAQNGAIVVLTAARLLDPSTGRITTDAAMLVRDTQIVWVGPRSGLSVPPGATVVDLPGHTLLPGLIDAHVHLTLPPTPEANAAATVRAGFTTVVDLGALDDAAIRLRDRVAAGQTPGPRIFAAGQWVGVRSGTCDFSGIGVSHQVDSVLAQVRRQLDRGADFVKLCVSGWVAGAYLDPTQRELTDSMIAGAVGLASARGKRVIAHAISRAAITASLRNGVAALAHSGFMADSDVSLGAVIMPTLAAFAGARSTPPVDSLFRHVGVLVGRGVPMVFGTDAGVIAHGSNATEFAWLVQVGLTPLDAIRTATTAAAHFLGQGGRLGSLEPGYRADIIAAPGDPLTDVRALEQVDFVMQGGRIIRRP